MADGELHIENLVEKLKTIPKVDIYEYGFVIDHNIFNFDHIHNFVIKDGYIIIAHKGLDNSLLTAYVNNDGSIEIDDKFKDMLERDIKEVKEMAEAKKTKEKTVKEPKYRALRDEVAEKIVANVKTLTTDKTMQRRAIGRAYWMINQELKKA